MIVLASIRRLAARSHNRLTYARKMAIGDPVWTESRLVIQTFHLDMKRGLHEGIIGDHQKYWQDVVNAFVYDVAEDPVLVRKLMKKDTLFGQIKFLTDETAKFIQNESGAKGNYELVVAFCHSIKSVSPH